MTERPQAPPRDISGRRERVLDAAEDLFSHHGFDGVSVRQVARQAGVDVALLNYYFVSKQGLYDATLGRRTLVLNGIREAALNAAIAAAPDRRPSLEAIICAFIEPMKTLPIADPAWRNYCRLVAQVNSSSVLSPMMTAHFDPLILKFIAALRQALPHISDRELYWGYHCLSGALTLTMAATGRIDRLSGGLCRSEDAEDAYNHLIRFHTAAFRALEEAARIHA